MLDVDRFWRDGFLVIPQVFDPAVVATWRQAAFSRPNRRADLLSDPVLQHVILSERLISIAAAILDCERPVYFGDSTAEIGRNGWGFHKDNSDRLDGNAPDWKTDRYPIIRFGIYTKLHGEDEPGAIEFRRGSHLIPDYTSGERYAVTTRPGDVVVWNSRTTHSGNARIARVFGWRPMPDNASITFRVLRKTGAENWLMKTERETRVAIFASYGKDDPLLHRHVEYLKTRAYTWEGWKASHWTDEAKATAERRGLDLIDPTGFEWDGSPLNVMWAPIPYELPERRVSA
jgi:hypothetical protein